MELTKRRALEICRDMWDWLADNPEREKEDWPGWEEVGRMLDNCPCCEYTCQQVGDFCDHCPLYYYWPENDCGSDNSPFRRWLGSNLHYRSMYARRIANYARKALKELDKNDN